LSLPFPCTSSFFHFIDSVVLWGPLLFARIKRKRPDLRLVVSSATMDALAFKEFFEDAPSATSASASSSSSSSASASASAAASASASAAASASASAAASAKASAKAESAVILTVDGRQFPVDVFYTQFPVRNFLHAAIETVKYIHTTQPPVCVL
jgi:hypothetical protein